MKKIPEFKSDEEAARFWETHSLEDYIGDTLAGEISFIRKPKRAVTIRLDPDDVKKVEKIAAKKGLNYTALIRMWIRERLAA